MDEDLQGKQVDATLYRGMIGSLMYFTASRPDLNYDVCLCDRYVTHRVLQMSDHAGVSEHWTLVSTSGSALVLSCCKTVVISESSVRSDLHFNDEDVFKRKITMRVGEGKIIFKSIKPTSSLIKRVYMLSLRERMELDLEARLIEETLMLNRSLDPFFEDYIELNDLNVPLELRRDQVDNLMPTIEEDFAVLEDMDAYRDEGIGDVIFSEPFLREVGINAKQFDGMITIYNDNESVTYQMVRSHLRFKHHTNEQCNKILPLLKVSEEDKMNGISHSYQKHKGFYKGVLNLGPEYVRGAKMEEWLTYGHISMHEME
ncbi:hypothetical protein Tco_0497710 [Tanacetum coccineum]